MQVRSLITLSLFCFFSLHAADEKRQADTTPPRPPRNDKTWFGINDAHTTVFCEGWQAFAAATAGVSCSAFAVGTKVPPTLPYTATVSLVGGVGLAVTSPLTAYCFLRSPTPQEDMTEDARKFFLAAQSAKNASVKIAASAAVVAVGVGVHEYFAGSLVAVAPSVASTPTPKPTPKPAPRPKPARLPEVQQPQDNLVLSRVVNKTPRKPSKKGDGDVSSALEGIITLCKLTQESVSPEQKGTQEQQSPPPLKEEKQSEPISQTKKPPRIEQVPQEVPQQTFDLRIPLKTNTDPAAHEQLYKLPPQKSEPPKKETDALTAFKDQMEQYSLTVKETAVREQHKPNMPTWGTMQAHPVVAAQLATRLVTPVAQRLLVNGTLTCLTWLTNKQPDEQFYKNYADQVQARQNASHPTCKAEILNITDPFGREVYHRDDVVKPSSQAPVSRTTSIIKQEDLAQSSGVVHIDPADTPLVADFSPISMQPSGVLPQQRATIPDQTTVSSHAQFQADERRKALEQNLAVQDMFATPDKKTPVSVTFRDGHINILGGTKSHTLQGSIDPLGAVWFCKDMIHWMQNSPQKILDSVKANRELADHDKTRVSTFGAVHKSTYEEEQTLQNIVMRAKLYVDDPKAGPFAQEVLKLIAQKEHAESVIQAHGDEHFPAKQAHIKNAEQTTFLLGKANATLDSVVGNAVRGTTFMEAPKGKSNTRSSTWYERDQLKKRAEEIRLLRERYNHDVNNLSDKEFKKRAAELTEANKEWQHISGALQKMEQEGLSRVHATHEYAAYDGSLVGTEFAETKPQQQLQIKEPATPSKESTVLPCFTERPDLPTTFVTPVDDTPKVTTTACPGMRPEDVPSKNDVIICGGMTIPEQKPLHTGHPVELVKPILHLAQTVNDAIGIVKKLGKNVRPMDEGGKDLDQYVMDGTYEEGVEILKKSGAVEIEERIMGGKPAVLGKLKNGTIIVRQISKGKDGVPGLPTIEIQEITDGKPKYTKFRLQEEKPEAVE
jgi:hypothetical protein